MSKAGGRDPETWSSQRLDRGRLAGVEEQPVLQHLDDSEAIRDEGHSSNSTYEIGRIDRDGRLGRIRQCDQQQRRHGRQEQQEAGTVSPASRWGEGVAGVAATRPVLRRAATTASGSMRRSRWAPTVTTQRPRWMGLRFIDDP